MELEYQAGQFKNAVIDCKAQLGHLHAAVDRGYLNRRQRVAVNAHERPQPPVGVTVRGETEAVMPS